MTPQTTHTTLPSGLRVDLHLHSTASDGCWPPEELVRQVRDAGIGLFAVADHDTTENVPQVARLAQQSNIGFIPAVEISCTLQDTGVHLLAFGISPQDPSLLSLLQANWDRLASVDDQSINKLIQAGRDITWQEYERYEDQPTRGGWRALNFLIDRGLCSDVRSYFSDLFVGELALTYPTFAHANEAVEIAAKAGGTVICAHPGHSLRENRAQLESELLACGVKGFECHSPYHSPEMTRHYVELCRKHDLLITAGSDCHGGFARRAIGQPPAFLGDLNLGPLLDHVRLWAA